MLHTYLLLPAVFSLVTLSTVALPFTSDGVAKLPGFHTHSLYTAYHYRPLCGTLDPGVGDKPYSSEFCAPAMIPYRQTSDTFAIYDVVGVRQSDTFAIGNGTDVCMCFSLSETTGKQSDYCALVDANGQGNIDHGQYMRGSKALPQCSAIDVSSVTASLGNLGTQTRAQIVGATSVSGPAATGGNGPAATGTGGTNSGSASSSFCPAVRIWLSVVLVNAGVVQALPSVV